MSSGPDFESADDLGRVVIYGFLLSGDVTKGYRARAIIPLTFPELQHGCRDVVFGELLPEILVQLHAEMIKREMIANAIAAGAPDRRTAHDGESVTGAQNRILAILGAEGPMADHALGLRLGCGLMAMRAILATLQERGLVRCRPDDLWSVAKPLDPPITRP